MKKGVLITLSGISGCGKSFLKKYAWKMKKIAQLMTVTTREKRIGEVNVKDKIFIDENMFNHMLESNEIFFDNKLFAGKWYAYRAADLERLKNGKCLIADISYDCVTKIKSEIKSDFIDVISIYIKPQDITQTIYKLKKRKLPEKEYHERVEKIKEELEFFEKNSNMFDYVIENDYGEDFKRQFDRILQKFSK